MTVHQLKPIYKPTLADKIESFRDVDRQLKALTKKHKAMQQEITDAMGETTEAYNDVGHVIATYIFVKGEKFNRKAFDLVNPGFYDEFEQLCKQYNEPNITRRFQLK